MARSILETQFRGDDSHFQRAGRRVRKTAGSIHGAALKMNGVLATFGGGMAISGVVQKFDRIAKVAERLNTTSEAVQRLSFAAEQSGSSLEQLQGILTRLERRTGEALNDPNSAAAKAFKELNIEVEKFQHLDVEQKIWRVADAFVATGKSERGVASLMKLLDTEVREMIPLLGMGGDEIEKLGNSIRVLSDDSTQDIERMSDAFNRFSTSVVAGAAGPIASAFEMLENGILSINALLVAAVDPWITYEEALAGAADVLQERIDEREKASAPPTSGLGLGGKGTSAPRSFRDSAGFGRTIRLRGAEKEPYRPPLSGAAKKSESERDKFFKEARENMKESKENVATVAAIMTNWAGGMA